MSRGARNQIRQAKARLYRSRRGIDPLLRSDVLSTAIHEAGHAVVCEALGWPTKFLTVDPSKAPKLDFVSFDSNDKALGYHELFDKPTGPLELHIPRIISGDIAEMFVRGEKPILKNWVISTSDFSDLQQMIPSTFPQEDLSRWLSSWFFITWQMISQFWNTITEVAVRVVTNGILHRPEYEVALAETNFTPGAVGEFAAFLQSKAAVGRISEEEARLASTRLYAGLFQNPTRAA